MKKRFWILAGLSCIALGLYGYSQLSQSQKRYIAHIIKQVRYMPARYQV